MAQLIVAQKFESQTSILLIEQITQGVLTMVAVNPIFFRAINNQKFAGMVDHG